VQRLVIGFSVSAGTFDAYLTQGIHLSTFREVIKSEMPLRATFVFISGCHGCGVAMMHKSSLMFLKQLISSREHEKKKLFCEACVVRRAEARVRGLFTADTVIKTSDTRKQIMPGKSSGIIRIVLDSLVKAGVLAQTQPQNGKIAFMVLPRQVRVDCHVWNGNFGCTYRLGCSFFHRTTTMLPTHRAADTPAV
jgi:hypothetical protein